MFESFRERKGMMLNLRGKNLLVLGGNPYADAIKDFCTINEINILSVSNDPNAAIHKIANKSFVHDSTDLAFLETIINKENVDGIYMGGNEYVITKVCTLVNRLGFPCYCTPQQWTTFQNKAKFKQLCKDAGLPVVKRYNYSPESPCDIHFPVITKPVDGAGSKGFSICNSYEELNKGYNKAKQNSFSGDVIVEDYVKNSGHVVFYSFSNGKPYFCQLHDKYPVQIVENGSYIAGLHVSPSNFTTEFIDLYHDKLCKMFKKLKIKEGTLWMEVFHDGNKYYFNEAGFRYGGSSSTFPIDYFNHINQIAADIFYCLTGKSELFGFNESIPEHVSKDKRYYCMLPIHSKSGKINQMTILPKLEKSSNIVKVIIKRQEGWIVPNTGDFSQNIAYIHFVYNDREEFLRTINLIRESLIVLDEEGKDMLVFQDETFFDKVRIN